MKSLFAIFDYLGSEYFQTRLNKDDLINEVFEFYLLSKSNCSKKYLQQAFRSCFNGICQHDAGSVHFGHGHSPTFGSTISSYCRILNAQKK